VTPDDSSKIAQADTMPADNYVPMTRWEAGELVPEVQSILLDASAPPGAYRVILGMYDPLVMQNVRVVDAPEVWPGDRLALATVEVRDCQP
jgi:hypothetical protein